MAERIMNGQAWRDFCLRLADAGEAILRPECPDSPEDRSEGYRYLLGYLTSTLMKEMYDPGPDHPAFVRSMDDVLKFGLDAPDGTNAYSVTIRDDLDYRIFGKAKPATYIGWQFMGPTGTLHNCSLDEFSMGEDGYFEIILSRKQHDGNWIKMPDGARSIMQRQFHLDWDNEDYTEIHIETLEPQPGLGNCIDPLPPQEVEARLDSLGQQFEYMANFWVDFVHGFRKDGDNIAPPAILNPSIGGSLAQFASNGYFVVEPGQALILEFEPPNARYWSVVLGNFWFMSIDLHDHQSSLNAHQANVDSDGNCRIVIAHGDPGIANWLDPFGHRQGTMTFRWLLADRCPEIRTLLVDEAKILDHLPADTRLCSEEERNAVMDGRRMERLRRHQLLPTSRWFYPPDKPA